MHGKPKTPLAEHRDRGKSTSGTFIERPHRAESSERALAEHRKRALPQHQKLQGESEHLTDASSPGQLRADAITSKQLRTGANSHEHILGT